jgi:hypothetical protein
MKVRDLKDKVYEQVESENKAAIENLLAERIREISAIRVCLRKAEKSLEELMEMDVEDVILL